MTMAEIKKISLILLRCPSDHRFKTDFQVGDTGKFPKFVQQGHSASCPTCGIAVVATSSNTVFITDDGKFGNHDDIK